MASKKQQVYYVLLVVLAVLAGVTLLNSLNQAPVSVTPPVDTGKVQQEKMTAEAIASLALTQKYQRYCVKGVQRIDTAGDYSRVVYGTVQKTITYYDKDGKKVYCTEGVTNPSETCAAINDLNFETTYVCSGTPIASTLSGGNGIQVKTQTIGNATIIDKVVLENPGYVIIQKKQVGSKPADILSVSELLKAGTSEIVSIAMPESLRQGQTYTATLYTDNGDGIFKDGEDTALTNDKGEKLMVSFSAIAEVK